MAYARWNESHAKCAETMPGRADANNSPQLVRIHPSASNFSPDIQRRHIDYDADLQHIRAMTEIVTRVLCVIEIVTTSLTVLTNPPSTGLYTSSSSANWSNSGARWTLAITRDLEERRMEVLIPLEDR